MERNESIRLAEEKPNETAKTAQCWKTIALPTRGIFKLVFNTNEQLEHVASSDNNSRNYRMGQSIGNMQCCKAIALQLRSLLNSTCN